MATLRVPANVDVEEVKIFSMTGKDVMYDFIVPPAGAVSVKRTFRREVKLFTLDREEARSLWSRLKVNGYERF